MATYQLTVGPDGRVTIPDTFPGQSLVIQVVPKATADGGGTGPIPEEEQEEIKARVKKLASEMRSKLPNLGVPPITATCSTATMGCRSKR